MSDTSLKIAGCDHKMTGSDHSMIGIHRSMTGKVAILGTGRKERCARTINV